MSGWLRQIFLSTHKAHGLAWLSAMLLVPWTVSAANTVEAFGLTFVAKEGATLTLDEEGFVLVEPVPVEPGHPTYGVTILLGQADTGVFVNPSTDFDNEACHLVGDAFGSLAGVTNQRLCTVRGYRIAYGAYTIEADLSPLGPRTLTYMIFNGSTPVIESTVDEVGTVTADFSNIGSATPRVNPLWRMPCGSVGVLIEFDSIAEVLIPGHFGSDQEEQGHAQGNRVFIRANDPTNHVDFVSHVQADAVLEVPSFSFTDARLGVFGRGHKALGQATFAAAVGSLTLSNVPPAPTVEEAAGVAIEVNEAVAFAAGVVDPVDGAGQFAVHMIPVDLQTPDAFLEASLMGVVQVGRLDFGQVAGSAKIVNQEGALRLLAAMPGNRVRVAVFDQGQPVANAVLPEFVSEVSVVGTPRVIACGAQANSLSDPPGYSFRFDQPTTFTATNGLSLTGDEIRVQAVDVSEGGTNGVRVTCLQSFLIHAANLPSLTITAETEQGIELPELTIENVPDYVIVSWPDPNRIFLLEAAPSVEGPFFTLPNEITWSGHMASVRVSTEASSQVFRLGTQRRTRHVD